MELHEPEDGDPTRQPCLRVDRHRAGEDVADERAELCHDPIDLQRGGEVDGLRPAGWDATWLHRGVADLGAAVEEAGAAFGVVGEGGVVGVVDADGEVEGDVELDADGGEGDAGGNAFEADGDEVRRGVADFEDGEGEGEGGARE